MEGAQARCSQMLQAREKPPFMLHLIWQDYTRLAKEIASAAVFGPAIDRTIARRREMLEQEFAGRSTELDAAITELTETMASFAAARDPTICWARPAASRYSKPSYSEPRQSNAMRARQNAFLAGAVLSDGTGSLPGSLSPIRRKSTILRPELWSPESRMRERSRSAWTNSRQRCNSAPLRFISFRNSRRSNVVSDERERLRHASSISVLNSPILRSKASNSVMRATELPHRSQGVHQSIALIRLAGKRDCKQTS